MVMVSPLIMIIIFNPYFLIMRAPEIKTSPYKAMHLRGCWLGCWLDVDWDVDWCWLMLTDVDWCWFMHKAHFTKMWNREDEGSLKVRSRMLQVFCTYDPGISQHQSTSVKHPSTSRSTIQSTSRSTSPALIRTLISKFNFMVMVSPLIMIIILNPYCLIMRAHEIKTPP